MDLSDPLDSAASGPSWLTGQPLSDEYRALARNWSRLPMYDDKQKVAEFFDLLRDKQVMLLVSGTGSGKTVLVPKFVLRYLVDAALPGKVAVTNPKTLTTEENARYAASTLDVVLGEEVGYRFKNSPDGAKSPASRLLYVTDGLILATLLGHDPLLLDYACVVVDEAHERNVQIDLLLMFLKKVLRQRSDFKVIIMSATINPEVFRDYFAVDGIKYGELHVSGASNYPIKQRFVNKAVGRHDYVLKCVERVVQLVTGKEEGDIVVFVATENDARSGCDLLRDKCPQSKQACQGVFCVEVFGKMRAENKKLAIDKTAYKAQGYSRKVIFATNVAESSITLDGIVHVVDSGYELAKYYDAEAHAFRITKQLTTRAQVMQRIGRSGRTQPGVAHHIYSQAAFDSMREFPEPNMRVVPITEYLLAFLRHSGTVKRSYRQLQQLITPPTWPQVRQALYTLELLGALRDPSVEQDGGDKDNYNKDEKPGFDHIQQQYRALTADALGGSRLNRVGRALLSFSGTSVFDAYAMLLARANGCLPPMRDCVAVMTVCEGKVDSLFAVAEERDKARAARAYEDCVDADSDFLTAFNVYQAYKSGRLSDLNAKLLAKVETVAADLDRYVSRAKPLENLPSAPEAADLRDKLLFCIARAYAQHEIKRSGGKDYATAWFLRPATAPVQRPFICQGQQSPKKAVCVALQDAFGKKTFVGVSAVPHPF